MCGGVGVAFLVEGDDAGGEALSLPTKGPSELRRAATIRCTADSRLGVLTKREYQQLRDRIHLPLIKNAAMQRPRVFRKVGTRA